MAFDSAGLNSFILFGDIVCGPFRDKFIVGLNYNSHTFLLFGIGLGYWVFTNEFFAFGE